MDDLFISCPFCSEGNVVSLDEGQGRQQLVIDCEVCCRSIEILARVGGDGEVEILSLKPG